MALRQMVQGIADRARVVAEWFGALPVDEYPTYEPPSVARRLADDRNDVELVMDRFERRLWTFAIAIFVVILVAQVHIRASRPPAPVVGSYYLEHDGSGK